jgi:hypothetical protein
MIGALFLLPLLPTSLLANPVVEERQIASRQYIISNQCPASINLYIGGQFDAILATGGNTTKFLAETAGLFYTDANGGNVTGSGTLRAGFYGSVSLLFVLVASRGDADSDRHLFVPLGTVLLSGSGRKRTVEYWDECRS